MIKLLKINVILNLFHFVVPQFYKWFILLFRHRDDGYDSYWYKKIIVLRPITCNILYLFIWGLNGLKRNESNSEFDIREIYWILSNPLFRTNTIVYKVCLDLAKYLVCCLIVIIKVIIIMIINIYTYKQTCTF